MQYINHNFKKNSNLQKSTSPLTIYCVPYIACYPETVTAIHMYYYLYIHSGVLVINNQNTVPDLFLFYCVLFTLPPTDIYRKGVLTMFFLKTVPACTCG